MDDKTLILECEDVDLEINHEPDDEEKPDFESLEFPPVEIKPEPFTTPPPQSRLVPVIKLEPDTPGPEPGYDKIKREPDDEEKPDIGSFELPLVEIKPELSTTPPSQSVVFIKPEPSTTPPHQSGIDPVIKLEPDTPGPEPGYDKTGDQLETQTPENSLEPAFCLPAWAPTSNQQQVNCTLCDEMFSNAEGLEQHQVIHWGQKEIRFITCDENSCANNLTNILHSGEKLFKCTACGKSFTQAEALKQHQVIHSEEKLFKCTLCDTSFLCSGDLKRHQAIHSEDKPFKCTMCDKSYTQAGSLSRHQVIHSGEKPYKCTVCGKSFAQAVHRKGHQLVHSGEKPFKCTLCDKSFSQAANLKQHQAVHLEEKPFQCTTCRRFFSNARYLKQHQLIHSGEKPYKCTVCDKAFSQAGTRNKHKLIHERETLTKSTV